MSCERYLELLSVRLDGALSGGEEQELEEHLANCPACRAVGAQLAALQSAFGELEDIPAPEGFSKAVMERIRAGEGVRKTAPWFRRPQLRALAGLAACLALAAGLYGTFQLTGRDRADRPAMEELQETDSGSGSAPIPRCTPEEPGTPEAPGEAEDAPMATAYALPEADAVDDALQGASKTIADGEYHDGMADAAVPNAEILTLEYMPEGGWELIPPELALSPEGLYVTKDLLEQVKQLAAEQGITAELTSVPEETEAFIIVVLEAIE